MPGPILLYDGVCGLCNRLVQFILLRDTAGLFRFASLQSGLAERILVRHGANARDLDTVYVLLDHEQTDERLLPRSDAVIFILKNLGATDVRAAGQPSATHATRGFVFWRLVGQLLQVAPRWLRDWGYGVVARNRYRIFGRYEACPVPSSDTRARFLDL